MVNYGAFSNSYLEEECDDLTKRYRGLEELYLGKIVKPSDYYGNDIYPSLNTIKKITFGKCLKVVGTGAFGYNIYDIPTTAEVYCENLTPPSFGEYQIVNKHYI